jgi:methionyl-tRNA synthetase
MPKTFFITTAIYYTNSSPHVGHAYEMVLADVIARYHRLKGEEVFFLTGVDQHGQKVQQSAAKAGVAPAEFVKEITQKFVDLGRKLDVKYDEWAETTSDRHKKVVQGILKRLFDEGQIYKDKQSGYYSVRQEQFLTDKERGPDGQFGPEWGEIEFREEENYYFKLSQHKEWLLQYLERRADAVIPDFRQKELRNAVERISGDLCISRPKSRLDWGIELPFDKDFVTYVWFDALTNYISFAGYDSSLSTFNSQPSTFRDKWPALQIIGKDILVPAHGIYWLIMLHAIGFPDEQMPQLLVHGWWNIGGAKMSKSVGNIVDPFLLIDKYGADALRYYLMSDIATGSDADFAIERQILRYTGDLADTLGNLVNRTVSMIWKYRAGKLKETQSDRANLALLRDLVETTSQRYASALQLGHVSQAIEEVIALVRQANVCIEAEKPWILSTELNRASELDAVLYYIVETIRIAAILLSPVVPRLSHEICNQLNWRTRSRLQERRFTWEDTEWGGLRGSHSVSKAAPLVESWPRIANRLMLSRLGTDLGGTFLPVTDPSDRGVDAIIKTDHFRVYIECKSAISAEPPQVAQFYAQFDRSVRNRPQRSGERFIFAFACLRAATGRDEIIAALEMARRKQSAIAEYRLFEAADL